MNAVYYRYAFHIFPIPFNFRYNPSDVFVLINFKQLQLFASSAAVTLIVPPVCCQLQASTCNCC